MEKEKKLYSSIDREYGSKAREKIRFLHGSVRRYKPYKSSNYCGCRHNYVDAI